MRAMVMMVVAAVTLAVCGPAAATQSFDNLLPDDTVFVLSVRNMPELLTKVKETSGYKIFEKLNLLERLAPPDKYAEIQQFYGTFIEPLGGICSGEVAVAATSLEGFGDNKPPIAFLIDVSQGEAALDEFLNGTVLPLLAEKGIQAETQEIAGVKVTRINPAAGAEGPPIFYAIKDGLLVAAFRDDVLDEILANTGPGVARAMLPSNTHYASARKVLGQTDVMLYVNLAPILAKVRAEKEAEGNARDWAGLAMLGFDKLQNVAFGMSLGPDGGTSTVRLTTSGEPGGWLGTFVDVNQPFESLKYVPAEAGLYYAVNMGDLATVYTKLVEALESFGGEGGDFDAEEFEGGVAKIEAVLGMKLDEDVLAGFGGEIALMAKVPEAIGVPPAALLIEVKDEAKVEAFVARVIELITGLGGDQVRTTTSEYQGTQIVTVLLPAPVAPAVAIVGGEFLVVGTSTEAVKAVVDAKTGGVSLASRPDYRASMAGLPTTGAAMMYVDIKKIYEFVFPLVAAGVHGDGAASDLIRDLGGLGEYLSGFAMVVSGDESGITYRTHSQSALLEPMLLFGTAAVVPAVFRAREVAQDTASMSNVKQLCMAAIMYENEHGTLPEKMSDLAEYAGAASVFVHPRNAKNAALIDLEKPETIDQYTDYELVTKGGTLADIDDPGNTVLIQEKEGVAKGPRVKGYVDGHVTRHPEPGEDAWIEGDAPVRVEINVHTDGGDE
jgi:hypothetical protein